MKNAKTFEKLIKVEHSKRGRLLRNNVGSIKINDRYVSYGLGKGSSDLIGWTSVTITPDMVGQKVAIFTAIELKTENDRASKEQKNFIKIVQAAGGFAKIIFNLVDYKNIFNLKNQNHEKK